MSKSITMKPAERTVVRCSMNKFNTPLLSYDDKGIYVRCKDCRTTNSEGDIKRGTFHLITWSQLQKLSLNLVTPEQVMEEASLYHDTIGPGPSASGDNTADEESATDSIESTG